MQDPAEFCKSFIQCSQEADKARQECDKLIIIAMPSGNGSESAKPAKAGGDCASNVKNISELLIQKQTDQRQQQRDCLNSHLGEATFGGDKSRVRRLKTFEGADNEGGSFQQDQCKKLSAAASSSKPKRQKRKVAKDEPAKNATAAIHGNGTSPAPAVKEEKEATNGSAAPQSTDYAAYAKCLQAAEVKAEQCKPIAACCSEIQT